MSKYPPQLQALFPDRNCESWKIKSKNAVKSTIDVILPIVLSTKSETFLRIISSHLPRIHGLFGDKDEEIFHALCFLAYSFDDSIEVLQNFDPTKLLPKIQHYFENFSQIMRSKSRSAKLKAF